MNGEFLPESIFLCSIERPQTMHKIVLFQTRTKPVLQGHSWIFSGAIKENDAQKTVGIAEITDENGRTLGFGFTDPESQISCRIFHFGQKPTEGFKSSYWLNKFKSAKDLRHQLLNLEKTDTYRLIHAEGDGLPGMVVDIYGGKTAVLHTLIHATGQWTETWKSILMELGYPHIYHRHGHDKNGKWLGENGAELIQCLENGLKFWVNIEKGQKTGFFIDQRDSRQYIGTLSKNRKVLNAFGFTGGFSIYALAGGASEVFTVDISKDACVMAQENATLNGYGTDKHTAISADCFDYLRDMDPDFDLIILDPPAFAKNAHSVDKATKGYKDINLQTFKKCKTGSLVASFSCSQHIDRDLFRKVLIGAAQDSGKAVQILHSFDQPADHPIAIGHPEGEYLKGFLMRVS